MALAHGLQDLEFCWLQHPAFGEPFIAPGTFEKQLKAGTIPKIKGNTSTETEIKAVVYTGLTKVKRITREGKMEEA